MPGGLELDTSWVWESALGAGRGVDRARFGSLASRVAAGHEELIEAASAGWLPHVSDLGDARAPRRAADRARRWARSAEELVVLAEPGVADMLRCWTALVDAPPVRFVAGPDPAGLRRALAGGGRMLVVFDGPPWVRALAERLVADPEGPERAVVFAGDGTPDDGWKPRGARRIASPGCADGRFGAFGDGALAVAAFAGVDVAELVGGARAAAGACAAPALHGNPAWRLAAVAHLLGLRGGGPVLLAPAGGFSGALARHAARLWSALLVRRREGEGLRLDAPRAPAVLVAGDEGATNALAEDGDDAWLLVLPTPPAGAGDRWNARGIERALLDAHVEQALRSGRPVVRLRPTAPGALGAGAAAWMLTQAAVAAAVLAGVDPTALPAADELRVLHERAAGDSPPG